MKALYLASIALAMAAGFSLPLACSAEAAMGGALPATQILPVEQAQFFFLGHDFCWYDYGWRGPGWYWCNYAWRSGYGWGGGDGWRGWNRGQWHGNRGPVGRPPNFAPQNNVIGPPKHYVTPNNVGRTPQFNGGAVPRGPGPGHPNAGKKIYPAPDATPGHK